MDAINSQGLSLRPSYHNFSKARDQYKLTDYNKIVSQAIAVDHQIYHEEKLNRISLRLGAKTTGLTNLIVCPISVIRKSMKLFLNRFEGHTFDKKEAIHEIISDLVNFMHALGQLIEMTYKYSKALLGKMMTQITGLIFFPLETLYNIYMADKAHLVSRTLNFKARKVLLNLAELKDYKNSASLQKDVNKLLELTVTKHKYDLESYSSTKKDFRDSLNKLLKSLQKETLTESEFLTIKETIREETIAFLNDFLTNEFHKMDKRFFEIRPRESDAIKTLADEEFKQQSDSTKALSNTLETIQHYHKSRKIALARITRPWIAAKFAQNQQNILTKLKYGNKEEVIEALNKGFEIIKNFENIVSIKKKLHIVSVIVNIALLAGLIATLISCPIVTSVFIGGVAILWSLNDYAISRGFLDSEDGNFQPKRLIPPIINYLAHHLSMLPQRVSKLSQSIFNSFQDHHPKQENSPLA